MYIVYICFSDALEVLTDENTRKAYDNVLKVSISQEFSAFFHYHVMTMSMCRREKHKRLGFGLWMQRDRS